MAHETRFYHATRAAREQFQRDGDEDAYLGECVYQSLLLAAEEIGEVNGKLADLLGRIQDSEQPIKEAVRNRRHLVNTEHDGETHHHDILVEFAGHFRKQDRSDLVPVIDILDALEL